MVALRVRERDERDEPARLGRVVVLDGGLEVLPHRRRLPELPAEPPKEADRCLVGHEQEATGARRTKTRTSGLRSYEEPWRRWRLM